MNRLKIIGMGEVLPENKIKFGEATRYRITDEKSHLLMAEGAIINALKDAKLKIEDIDCIISTSSVSSQPLPNMSSLIHERVALGKTIPCIDINTTCTSFNTALDMVSYMIEANRYNKVLIVSSEVPSLALNKDDPKTYELFSDAATAFIVEKDNRGESGVITALQKTYSEGAHYTEIPGGGTSFLPTKYNENNKNMYKFQMQTLKSVRFSIKILSSFIKEVISSTKEKVDFIIPQQASQGLEMVLKKVNIKGDSYLNIVNDYGNMVSASIPFALKYAIDNNKIKKGDNVMLIGSAAGIHLNAIIIKY